MAIELAALDEALNTVRERLLAERNSAGHWSGELSSSALSTATATFALHELSRLPLSSSRIAGLDQIIKSGVQWLIANQNADGGWGDTVRSISNISTTTLCWAAFGAASGAGEKFRSNVAAAERWLVNKGGGTEPGQLARAIISRYGKDRTFSVPILTMC